MKAFRSLSLLLAASALTLSAAAGARASFHLMQIEQVIGGVNGDPSAQAIQLRMRNVGQNLVSSARLIARDAIGANPVTIIDFTSNVPNGAAGSRVLIATSAMSAATTPPMVPDFIMSNPIPASYLSAGTLTFESDTGVVYWRLSWGGSSYTGPGTGAVTNDADGNFNPPFAGVMPTFAEALRFRLPANAQSTNNLNDYALTTGAATFNNNAGAGFLVTGFPTGACCMPDNSCSNTTSGACAAAGGVYFGDGSNCGTIDCATAVILPGTDHLEGIPPSSLEFGGPEYPPIPADFFYPGSEPFTGIVRLGGLASDAASDTTDTRVERLESAMLPGTGSMDTIPIQILQLNLVSIEPIEVSGRYYDVFWSIDPTQPATGTMTITKTHANGGTFTSQFMVLPKFTFVPVHGGPAIHWPMGVPTTLVQTTPADWTYSDASGVGAPGGGPNFYPTTSGMAWQMSDGHTFVFDPAVIADAAKGACCFLDTPCRNLSKKDCIYGGGSWHGSGTRCAGDNFPPNGIDDACERIPAGLNRAESIACGGAEFNFVNDPIPADFFDPGSQPFDGTILLGGPSDGLPDTVIRRHRDALLLDGPPETIPIELVQLHLVSCQPITVQSGTGSTQWDVRVQLSPTVFPPVGSMTITKTHDNGGTFTSEIYVQPLLTFTRVDSPSDVRILDTGTEGLPPIIFQHTERPWVFTPPDPGIYDLPCAEGNFIPGVLPANTIGPIPYCDTTFYPGDLELQCGPEAECQTPDIGGTGQFPPACPEGYRLPFGSVIQATPGPVNVAQIDSMQITGFNILNQGPGGSLGGEFQQSQCLIRLTVSTVPPLPPYTRELFVPAQCETHTGPRTLGDPVQSFPTDMFFLQAQLPPGDPDFDLLRVVMGEAFLLPSPGHTTLTELPSGPWKTDSFFDIEYRIDFVGAPGSTFSGLSGSTTVTRRIDAGPEPEKRPRAVSGPSTTGTMRMATVTTPSPTIPPRDTDGDQWPDIFDSCLEGPDVSQTDLDGDSVGDLCDNCPAVYNPCQEDSDHNGIGDACQAPPCCVGNADKVFPGAVTFGDITAVLANFNQPANPDGTSPGDADCDGFITFADITAALANFNNPCL